MADACRSPEQVNNAAMAAGLHNRIGCAQVLKFTDNLLSNDYHLLEVPTKLMDSWKRGDRVVIRGDEQDDAVLCTENETFDLKLADTSNLMLLCPDTQLPDQPGFKTESGIEERKVCGCVSAYYELRPQRPKLQKLKVLLRDTAYKGEEYEKSLKESGLQTFTFDDLLERVQASEKEIREELTKLEALEIEGCWRVLDVDYHEKVMVHILNLLDENSWSYDKVPLKETCTVLEELEPSFVVAHCLQCYGENTSMDEDKQDTEAEVYYKLSETKICRFYAEYILRSTGMFNYHEFMDSWKHSVPEGMVADEEQLKGLVLTDMTRQPPVIWHFPKENLPQDPSMRFTRLFKTRAKWKLEDIQPYLTDLECPGQSLKALLLKFARCSTDSSGQKMYNSKRPIK